MFKLQRQDDTAFQNTEVLELKRIYSSHLILLQLLLRGWYDCSQQITCYREKGTLLHSWWEYKLVLPLRKTVCWFLKTLKIELSYEPIILFLYIYAKEIKPLSQRDICRLVFIVALITVSKTWAKPKYPLVDG